MCKTIFDSLDRNRQVLPRNSGMGYCKLTGCSRIRSDARTETDVKLKHTFRCCSAE
jgi:hypothetical protein